MNNSITINESLLKVTYYIHIQATFGRDETLDEIIET